MGLTIPAGEKAIDEERITLIKIIRRLSDTKNLTTLIDAVKERMRAEGVNWAESDKAIARLKDAGDDPTAINAKKFVDACREKKLPDRAVFGCLTVCKESAPICSASGRSTQSAKSPAKPRGRWPSNSKTVSPSMWTGCANRSSAAFNPSGLGGLRPR